MITTHEAILALISILENAMLDAQKFDDGTNVAGTRVRKSLQMVMKQSKAIRANILALQKQRKK